MCMGIRYDDRKVALGRLWQISDFARNGTDTSLGGVVMINQHLKDACNCRIDKLRKLGCIFSQPNTSVHPCRNVGLEQHQPNVRGYTNLINLGQ